MNLKKIGKVLTSKSVGTEPSSYEIRIYQAAVEKHCSIPFVILSLCSMTGIFHPLLCDMFAVDKRNRDCLHM